MTYASLMVHLDLGAPSVGLLKVAAELAERFKARVIGIAACQPMPIAFGDGYMSAEVIEQDRAESEKAINRAEADFRAALHGRGVDPEWRSTISYMALAEFVAVQARAADLLITGPDRKGPSLDGSRQVNIGDLVMRIGRPVLIVPPDVATLDLECVVIGWKESRETRRAVSDALPLLQQAGRVTVIEIVADEDLVDARSRLQDVVAWLECHGVLAKAVAAPSAGNDATHLDAIAREHGASLLVAGAYGHNRLREWVLGSVTRDLLLRPVRCSLVSH